MIRVRQQNGSVVEVTAAEAVEILDNDKRLAVVIMQDRKGTTHVAYPGDPLFTGYCKTQGVTAARVYRHGE